MLVVDSMSPTTVEGPGGISPVDRLSVCLSRQISRVVVRRCVVWSAGCVCLLLFFFVMLLCVMLLLNHIYRIFVIFSK